jgi:hypothetical protein
MRLSPLALLVLVVCKPSDKPAPPAPVVAVDAAPADAALDLAIAPPPPQPGDVDADLARLFPFGTEARGTPSAAKQLQATDRACEREPAPAGGAPSIDVQLASGKAGAPMRKILGDDGLERLNTLERLLAAQRADKAASWYVMGGKSAFKLPAITPDFLPNRCACESIPEVAAADKQHAAACKTCERACKADAKDAPACECASDCVDEREERSNPDRRAGCRDLGLPLSKQLARIGELASLNGRSFDFADGEYSAKDRKRLAELEQEPYLVGSAHLVGRVHATFMPDTLEVRTVLVRHSTIYVAESDFEHSDYLLVYDARRVVTDALIHTQLGTIYEATLIHLDWDDALALRSITVRQAAYDNGAMYMLDDPDQMANHYRRIEFGP